MVESFRLHDTITGAPRGISVHAPGRWSTSLTRGTTGRHSIDLSRTPYTGAQWRDATAPWARTLACLQDGVPMYAGLIRRRTWDEDTSTLTLETVTVDALLRDRYPFGVGSYLSDPDFVIVNASLRSAVERTIRYVAGANWGDTWDLPFRFTRLTEAGDYSRTFKKDEWATAHDIIRGIREMVGGPDVAFHPAYAGTSLVWDVLTGDPRVPGPVVDLPLSTRRTRARGLVIDEDGSNMVSGVFGRGTGVGRAKKVARAGYFTGGAPADAPPMIVRDVAKNMPAEGNIDDLDSRTQAYLDGHTWPVKQFSFDLLVDDRARQPSFDVTKLRLGTRLNGRYSGGPFHDAFTQMLYTVALSFDSGSPDEFRPEVQVL